MEARKEKQQQQINEDEMGKAREVIREAIISKPQDDHHNSPSSTHTTNTNTAQKAEDVLAYSRAVHHTDSSLQ